MGYHSNTYSANSDQKRYLSNPRPGLDFLELTKALYSFLKFLNPNIEVVYEYQMPANEKEKEEDKFEKKIKNKPDLPPEVGKAKKDDANEEVG